MTVLTQGWQQECPQYQSNHTCGPNKVEISSYLSPPEDEKRTHTQKVVVSVQKL